MKNVGVIFGGISPEHDISIITGCLVLNSLDKTKFNPVPIYVSKEGEWYTGDKLKDVSFYQKEDLKKCKGVFVAPPRGDLTLKKTLKKLLTLSAVVNCLHGGLGENGSIGGLFELCDVPFLGAGLFSASLSMDKILTKTFLKALSIPTVKGVSFHRNEFYKDRSRVIERIKKETGFPAIVKPATTGSSIGVSVGRDIRSVEEALVLAFKYDHRVLVETFLEGAEELNCAVYEKDGEIFASEIEKPFSSNGVLTFTDKYQGGKLGVKKREFPANIPDRIKKEIQDYSKKVYGECSFSSIIRIDYLLKDNKVFLNEINSVPGSFAYYLFCEKISELTGLLTDLLEETFKKSLTKKGSLTSFESSVLSFDGISLKK